MYTHKSFLLVAVACEQADKGDEACKQTVGYKDYEAPYPVVERIVQILQNGTPCDDPDASVTATRSTTESHSGFHSMATNCDTDMKQSASEETEFEA